MPSWADTRRAVGIGSLDQMLRPATVWIRWNTKSKAWEFTRAIIVMTEARSYSPVDFVRAFPSGKTDDLAFIREGDLLVASPLAKAKPKHGVAPLAPDSTERKITFDE